MNHQTLQIEIAIRGVGAIRSDLVLDELPLGILVEVFGDLEERVVGVEHVDDCPVHVRWVGEEVDPCTLQDGDEQGEALTVGIEVIHNDSIAG